MYMQRYPLCSEHGRSVWFWFFICFLPKDSALFARTGWFAPQGERTACRNQQAGQTTYTEPLPCCKILVIYWWLVPTIDYHPCQLLWPPKHRTERSKSFIHVWHLISPFLPPCSSMDINRDLNLLTFIDQGPHSLYRDMR